MMRVFYNETTGKIEAVSTMTMAEVSMDLPFLDVEKQDLSNKRVDVNTQTLIDKE